MELRGNVSSGLGRAQVFMAQEHYQSQFQELLGRGRRGYPNEGRGEHFSKYVALRNCSGIDTPISTQM